MARKNAVRTVITLVCEECSAYAYHSEKNKRTTADRLQLRKYCRRCRNHQPFKEKR